MARLMLLAAFVMSVSGQGCYSSDCSTCLSNPSCYYYLSCGYCTSYTSGPCNNEYPTQKSSMCPTPPTTAEAVGPLSSAYGLVSLGAVALVVMAVLVYTDIEKFCSKKIPSQTQGSSSSPNGSGGFGYNLHILFLSCICLWFGLSLDLASPALPWMVLVFARNTQSVNAFFIQICQLDSSKAPVICNHYTLMQYLKAVSANPLDQAFAQNALALGVIAYVSSIGLFFPCALMTSIAVYRLNKKIKFGIPPYTSGCSLTSLFVAQILGWTSFIIYSVVIFCATSLCSTVVSKFSGGNIQYISLPGSVAAGFGMALQLIGLILQAIVARSLISLPGIGCNRGGCCRMENEQGTTPPWQTNVLASVLSDNTLNDGRGGPVHEQFKHLSAAPTY